MNLNPERILSIISPEMVNAIGGLWRLALVILVIFSLLLFRKPLGRLASLLYNKLEGADTVGLKAGPVEASIKSVAREAVKEAVAEQTAKEEPKSEEATTQRAKTEPPSEPSAPPNLMNLLEAMHSHDRAEVDKIYNVIQEVEKDEASKNRNEAIYLYALFNLGDSNALGRLEDLAEKSSNPDALWWLGACYQRSHDW